MIICAQGQQGTQRELVIKMEGKCDGWNNKLFVKMQEPSLIRKAHILPLPHLPPLGPSEVQHIARGPTHVLTGDILPARPALWSASLLLSSSPKA